jgi:hypothetical protein
MVDEVQAAEAGVILVAGGLVVAVAVLLRRTWIAWPRLSSPDRVALTVSIAPVLLFVPLALFGEAIVESMLSVKRLPVVSWLALLVLTAGAWALVVPRAWAAPGALLIATALAGMYEVLAILGLAPAGGEDRPKGSYLIGFAVFTLCAAAGAAVRSLARIGWQRIRPKDAAAARASSKHRPEDP